MEGVAAGVAGDDAAPLPRAAALRADDDGTAALVGDDCAAALPRPLPRAGAAALPPLPLRVWPACMLITSLIVVKQFKIFLLL